MFTIDTNVLVRFAVRDDKSQANIAVQTFSNERIFLSITVLLESEWVLRSRYQYRRQDFSDFMLYLLGQENITIEDVIAVERAVKAHQTGMDFADALHCARAKTVFATFDQKLIKAAIAAGFEVKLLS